MKTLALSQEILVLSSLEIRFGKLSKTPSHWSIHKDIVQYRRPLNQMFPIINWAILLSGINVSLRYIVGQLSALEPS